MTSEHYKTHTRNAILRAGLVCCLLLPGKLQAQQINIGDYVIPMHASSNPTLTDGTPSYALQKEPAPWLVSRTDGDQVFFQFGPIEGAGFTDQLLPVARGIPFLEKEIRQKPNDAWAYQILGEVFSWQGKFDQAITNFKKVVEIEGETSSGLTRLARAESNLGKDDQVALAHFQRALELDPNNDQALYDRGMHHFGRDNFQLAIKDFDDAIERNPQHALALYFRAYLHMQAGQMEDALADYSRSIKANPLDSDPYVNRGNIYYQQSKYRLAIADYSIAIRLRSDHPTAYANRGAALMELGQSSLALLDLNQAIQVGPEYMTSYRLRSRALEDLSRYGDSIRDLDTYLASHADYDWGFFRRGRLLALTGDFDSAIEDVDRAIGLDPDYPDYYLEKAGLLVKSGQIRESLPFLDKAVEMDSSNYRYLLERARTFTRLSRYNQALQDLQKADRLAPDNLSITYLRSIVYSSVGNYRRAASDAKRCYQLAPENPFVCQRYSWILAVHPDAGARDPNTSLQLIKKVIDSGIQVDAETLDTLAAALAANGKFEKAIETQQRALQLTGDDPDPEMQNRLKLYENQKSFVLGGPAWFRDF